MAVWGGVRSIYDFDGKTAGKRAQVLIFSPFLASCSSLLAVLGQSVRALGLVLGMGGDLRPTGSLIGKMHKDSIRNAA